MEAIHYTQCGHYNMLKKAFQHIGFSDLRNLFTGYFSKQTLFFNAVSAKTASYQVMVKHLVNYLFKACLAGVKQNFLGPEIDTEFLTLTIRVYAILLIRLAFSHPSFSSLKHL
jgi:hypothetical protein